MLNTAQTVRDGRIFTANLVAAAYAPRCWPHGGVDPLRPVFAVFAGPLAEMRPFVANVREDGKLRLFGPMAGTSDSKGAPLEFMKSATYCYDSQIHDLATGPAVDPVTGRKRTERPGVVCTIYLPQLYNLDPIGGVNIDDNDAPFHYICMPGAARLAAETERDGLDNQAIITHLWAAKYQYVPAAKLKTFAAHAALVCAGIDRRLDIPIIHDPRFYAQLVAALLDAKLASWGCPRGSSGGYGYGYNSKENWGFNPRVSYMEENLEAAGYAPGICVSATRKEAIELIGRETARFERILSGADPDAGSAAAVLAPEAGHTLEDDVFSSDTDPGEGSGPTHTAEMATDVERLDKVESGAQFLARAALSDALAIFGGGEPERIKVASRYGHGR